MKRSIFCFVFLFSAGLLSAQLFQPGIKGGLNMARLTNMGSGSITIGGSGSTVSSKSVLGPHGGVYARINLSEKVYFMPEILYSYEGYKTSSETTTSGAVTASSEFNQVLHYIRIPAIFHVNASENVSLGIGAFYGILLGASYESYSNANGVESSDSGSNLDDLNTSDIGFAVNIGYNFDMGLNFGLRYFTGLSDIVDDSIGKHTSSVLQFYMGYHLSE